MSHSRVCCRASFGAGDSLLLVLLGDRLHLIDRDNDGIVDVEEIRDALAAIALRQNKFREDPEALEAFIQVALREIDANSDDVITVEEVEKWFDSLEEEVEDQ